MTPAFRWCAFVVVVLLAWPGTAAPKPRLPDTFDVRAIDAFLSAQVRLPARVGLSVAIMKDGRLVLAKGYGKCSLADGRPVEPDTEFAIGSVTKQFTSAAIFLLAEDGKLSVHDPVAKYYPELTRAKDITLLDLMNHVSGYPDYYPLDFVDRRMQQPITPDDLLRRYAGGKLDFEPGTKWSYSNTGFILLGRIVEKVSGERLSTFLARRIFRPLGMDHTSAERDASDPRLPTGYTTFALSDPEAVGPEAKGWLGAAGCIRSTPSDLAKWDLALMTGRVLRPDSYALMTSPRKLPGGRSTDYGCGLSVKEQGGRQVLSHNGAVSGFNAFNAMVPSTHSAVVLMCNLEGSLGSLPGELLDLLLKESSAVPTVAGRSAADEVKTFFAQLQRGKVDRKELGEEFNLYLTDQKLAGAARRLKGYGKPRKTEVLNTRERGGMEVTTTRLTFRSGNLLALMYRSPDGQIQEFFLKRE